MEKKDASLFALPRTLWTQFARRADTFARSSPSRLALIVFAAIILVITSLLSLPFATTTGKSAPFIEALFTATSAVCVTGLTTVDTATYWSTFGQAVIALAMTVGGLGVMTLASILGMAVSRKIGLTQKYLAAVETQADLGEVGSLIRAVLVVSASVQTLLFASLLPFFLSAGKPFLEASWHSLFMASSIFNNGGFVIMPEGLNPHVSQWGLTLPIILGTVTGAIGFPVVLDMWRNRLRPSRWNLTTKISLVTYAGLFLFGAVAIFAFEVSNPATLGELNLGDKIGGAMLHSTTARSSGLSTVPVGQMNGTTLFLLDSLMFIGGGSASAAGGIKVTTFAVLVLAIVAEARGDRDTEAFGKRLPADVLRLAIAAAFLGAVMVGIGCVALLHITHLPLEAVLFETISAFATCGLSTGITPTLPVAAKWVLVGLMFAGRTGTMSLAAALALRSRRRVIRLPEERPTIG